MTLSPRERLLASIVGAVLLILVNLMLVSAFSRRYTALRAQLSSRRAEWAAMQSLLSEQSLWAKRDAALTAKQPRLNNENAAGVELLDLVRSIALRDHVTLENESFPGITKASAYRSVPVLLDSHSSWPDLVSFLYTIQQPDQFIVCELATIQQDPNDASKILGHFKIARWYAP